VYIIKSSTDSGEGPLLKCEKGTPKLAEAAESIEGLLANGNGLKNAQGFIGCFGAGTHLRTPTGSESIENIETGDWLLSSTEQNCKGDIVARQVLQTTRRLSGIIKLKVMGREIRTTPEHPFWAKGKGWIGTTHLKKGDLVRSHDGEWIGIEGWEDTGELDLVYNLEVSHDHTYFVGHEQWPFSVWSHNSPPTNPSAAPVPAPKITGTASQEIQAVGQLQGKSGAEIAAKLTSEGYTPVRANNGGTIWTKTGSDGNTAAIRVDPPMVRPSPRGFADEVPHVHKEIVPTDQVVNGNYPPRSATTLNDSGLPSTDPLQTHIPGGQ
jgi:hypothetical protein